jgi:hypothetical protein
MTSQERTRKTKEKKKRQMARFRREAAELARWKKRAERIKMNIEGLAGRLSLHCEPEDVERIVNELLEQASALTRPFVPVDTVEKED